MAKEILINYKVFIWKSKVLQVLLSKRKTPPPNKEKLKRKN